MPMPAQKTKTVQYNSLKCNIKTFGSKIQNWNKYSSVKVLKIVYTKIVLIN